MSGVADLLALPKPAIIVGLPGLPALGRIAWAGCLLSLSSSSRVLAGSQQIWAVYCCETSLLCRSRSSSTGCRRATASASTT